MLFLIYHFIRDQVSYSNSRSVSNHEKQITTSRRDRLWLEYFSFSSLYSMFLLNMLLNLDSLSEFRFYLL